MKNKFYILVCLLGSCLVFLGCFFNKTENSDKIEHTYFIQTPFDVAIISKIQEAMSPKINKIIEEELPDVKLDKDVPIFFFKKRAAITVYYVNDMFIDAEPILFSSLQSMHNIPAPHNVTVSSRLDFFGEPKEDLLALIDLVVQIDDPEEGLFLLNKEAKKAVHCADEQYKNIYHVAMYDRAKSEKHSYLPHLSLGHLRPNYIKHLINDTDKSAKIIERMKQRIIETATKVLSELPLEDKKIYFDKLSVYDLQKRIYIQDFLLKS